MTDEPLKHRLLVTGAGGFLGWQICRVASATWQVYGMYHNRVLNVDAVVSVQADITDYRALKSVFNRIKPHAVIHAAAASRPNECEMHPQETHRVNVEASVSIAGLCGDAGIPCVFTSSDLVFDGRHPPYSEHSAVNPVCVYGTQKAAAEHEVLKRCPDSVVCRMPLMFGHSGRRSDNFFLQMVRSIREGKGIRLFIDEFRTPVDTESAAAGLLMALQSVRGPIHLGGRMRLSRYEMGLRLAQRISGDASMITPVSLREIDTPAPRAPDVSLDSSKAFRLGYKPLDFDEAIRRVVVAAG